MITNDEELARAYEEVTALTLKLTQEGVDPLVTAAALMSLGASVYRTTLSEVDFNLMMDAVSNLRDQVQRLGVTAQAPATLQ